MNKLKIKNIVGIGILSAILIILQLIANYIQFGPVSITLSLIPILVAATCYGPFAGMFLGFVNGILVLFAPSTLSVFFAFDPVGTIIVCLTKTSFAGLISGYVFKAFKNKKIGIVISSLLLPILNTLFFVIYSFIFFLPLIESFAGGTNSFVFLITVMIGYNFLIEFSLNAILSIASYRIYKEFILKND